MLNARFANGHPSNNLSLAGVLVRQFDNLDDSDDNSAPWLPCPQHTSYGGGESWCYKYSDRWATSIINSDARRMYFAAHGPGGRGGLVLAPRSIRMLCAYPVDGNSMDPTKVCEPLGGDGVTCIPGCYAAGKQCPDMHRDWQCSYPPSELREALRVQKSRDGYRLKNNEIVIEPRSVVDGLPESVEAFFVPRGSTPTERFKVFRYREAFLRAYPRLPPERQPPVLLLDLTDGTSAPFAPWVEE